MDDLDFKKICEVLSEEIDNFPAFDYEDILTEPLPRTRKDILEQEFFKNRFCCMQGWFSRLSFQKKLDIIKTLSFHTSNYYTIVHVLNTIYTARSKDWIYSVCQGLNLFKNDKILNDDNRTLDAEILEEVIKEQIQFFISLNDSDQYAMLMDMIQLSDSCIFGLAFSELLKILKDRLREKLQKMLELQPPIEPSENKSKQKKKGKEKKEKKDKKNKKGKKEIKELSEEEIEVLKQQEIEKKKQKEIEDIYNFLNAKFPDEAMFSTPAKLKEMLNDWNSFISNLNKRVGITIVQKAGKKDKKKKKEKTSKDLPDNIQLLPVWINKRIIATMDAKQLKNAKKVNKYWGFITKSVSQDVKCRQDLDKTCAKLRSNLTICNFEKVNTDIELKQKYCHITDVTDSKFRQRVQEHYNAQTQFTLLGDLYRQCSKFNVCGTRLVTFPRYTYAYKLDSLVEKTSNETNKESTSNTKLLKFCRGDTSSRLVTRY